MAKEPMYSTGEAAKRIGEALGMSEVTNRSVRRLVQRGEIPSEWTRPDSDRRDVNGKLMRGHRRIPERALKAWIKTKGPAFREQTEVWRERKRAAARVDT